MLRAFGLVAAFFSLLLLASAAAGQSPICVRYENGRSYVLPGCRGPGDPGYVDVDGTTGNPMNPFTGQGWGDLQVLSWNAMMNLVTPTVLVPLTSDPADFPTVVEAPFTVVLTASFSQAIPSGSRISRIRLTTKDLIEQFKQELGVSGRKARLVIRRDLADEEGAGSQLYMILDGVEYLVEGFIEPLPLSLPEGFYGRASGHKLSRRDGTVSSFHFQEVSALVLGDLAVDGFTMGLFSLDSGTFGPLARGQDAGVLCRKFTSTVTGGMQIAELTVDFPLLVTGTLQIGAERVLSP